ncbi:protein FAM53B [Protopterus annectens]|uniref:protein FAM53B n=1 Tax=Protopterus annectens TaxID=7888 RepID=UPI001CFACB60|nr:protein FAM53B [Protopterus annectens]XP_043912537.1 protein FAM53B [Protopterus annectens]
MVMLFTKALEDNVANAIRCRPFKSDVHCHKKMSEGPTLFSCGIMENENWRSFNKCCPFQLEQTSSRIDSIWDCLPDTCQKSAIWQRESSPPCIVTNLIKELSLNDHNGNHSAPPSKRQCRSLSFSDEFSSFRPSWRPVGSKVWTPVEKRRCYSGGSMPRVSNGFNTMQRSSSFSLPSRSNIFSFTQDQSGFNNKMSCQQSQGSWTSEMSEHTGHAQATEATSVVNHTTYWTRSLSCSHEQIPLLEYRPPSTSSTPASTPELVRRTSGLSRSKSQPCVHNEKKIGMKRRRQDDVQEQRPSLDLAKMTQRNFHSLTCLGISGDECSPQNLVSLSFTDRNKWTTTDNEADILPGITPASSPVLQHPQISEDSILGNECTGCEEAGFCVTREKYKENNETPSWKNKNELDDELDIEQIERN